MTTICAAIQIKMPIGFPLMAIFAANAPKIVGTRAAKIESPIAAKGPINPAFNPEMVSFA